MEMVRMWRPGELTPLEKADAPQPTTRQVGSVLPEFRFFLQKHKNLDFTTSPDFQQTMHANKI